MKVSIVTGVWKREKVFHLFAKNLPDWADVIVVGSEGNKSKKMVEVYGFQYIECPNKPLGYKMNKSTFAAKGSDYVVCMGSDDLISPEAWNELWLSMVQGYDVIGFRDFYFYDLKTKNAIYWKGYGGERKGKSIGVGRCLSKKVMDYIGWKCWDNNINKGLDSSMTKKIDAIKLPLKGKLITLKEKGYLAVDIKSDVNITPFRKWKNAIEINSKEIQQKFNLS